MTFDDELLAEALGEMLGGLLAIVYSLLLLAWA